MTEDLPLTLEEHREAFIEVSFLLDTFAGTIRELMGGATASVGRVAGRHAARRLPVNLEHPSLEIVLACVADQLKSGYEMFSQCSTAGAQVSFGRCAVRDVCETRRAAPGGDICTLFHFYVDGLVNELLHRPVKSEIVRTGDACEIRLQVR